MPSTPQPSRKDYLAWTDEDNARLIHLKDEHQDLCWREFHALNYFPGRSGGAVQVQYTRLKHGRPDGGKRAAEAAGNHAVRERERERKRLRSSGGEWISLESNDEEEPEKVGEDANNEDEENGNRAEKAGIEVEDDNTSSSDEGDITHTGEVVKIRERLPRGGERTALVRAISEKREPLPLSGALPQREDARSDSPNRLQSQSTGAFPAQHGVEHAGRVLSEQASSRMSGTVPRDSLHNDSTVKSPTTGAVSKTLVSTASSQRVSSRVSTQPAETRPEQREETTSHKPAFASSDPTNQNETLPTAESSPYSSVGNLTKTQCLEGTVQLLTRVARILSEEEKKEFSNKGNGTEGDAALRQRIADLESQLLAQQRKIQEMESSKNERIAAMERQMDEMAKRMDEMAKRAERNEQVVKAFTKFTTILSGVNGEQPGNVPETS